MANPGILNRLSVVKFVDFGAYLDGGEHGEILLPLKSIPEGTQVGDFLEVFIYFDSQDRIIATTNKPLVMAGAFALLVVKAVNRVGAFLDWGLEKDLMLPFAEQNAVLREGQQCLVYVYVDPESGRMLASARLNRFLDRTPHGFNPGDAVDLLIWQQTDLGYRAIVNQQYTGMLYENQIFQRLEPGMQVLGFISQVRPDGKLDLMLRKPGFEAIEDSTSQLLELLRLNEGFLPIGDKSHPEEVYGLTGMSKKIFKKALGSLYKKGMVKLDDNSVELLDKNI